MLPFPLPILHYAPTPCTDCTLHTVAKSVNIPLAWVPNSAPLSPATPCLLLVGQNPGYHEDLAGLPFINRSGEFLHHALLAQLNLPLPSLSIFLANTARCYHRDGDGPTNKHYSLCRHRLIPDLHLLAPPHSASLTLLTLGGPAATHTYHVLGVPKVTLSTALSSQGTTLPIGFRVLYSLREKDSSLLQRLGCPVHTRGQGRFRLTQIPEVVLSGPAGRIREAVNPTSSQSWGITISPPGYTESATKHGRRSQKPQPTRQPEKEPPLVEEGRQCSTPQGAAEELDIEGARRLLQQQQPLLVRTNNSPQEDYLQSLPYEKGSDQAFLIVEKTTHVTIMSTFHPAYVLRTMEMMGPMADHLSLLRSHFLSTSPVASLPNLIVPCPPESISWLTNTSPSSQ